MYPITLDQASTIIEVALKKGHELKLKPLVCCVLDAGGHLVAYKREDKSAIMRFQICYANAYGTLGMGFASHGLFERAQKNMLFVGAAEVVAQGRLMPVPGGVLILNADGNVCGAVGVSGDTSDNDEICAVAGIEAAGLKYDTGAGRC